MTERRHSGHATLAATSNLSARGGAYTSDIYDNGDGNGAYTKGRKPGERAVYTSDIYKSGKDGRGVYTESRRKKTSASRYDTAPYPHTKTKSSHDLNMSSQQ